MPHAISSNPLFVDFATLTAALVSLYLFYRLLKSLNLPVSAVGAFRLWNSLNQSRKLNHLVRGSRDDPSPSFSQKDKDKKGEGEKPSPGAQYDDWGRRTDVPDLTDAWGTPRDGVGAGADDAGAGASDDLTDAQKRAARVAMASQLRRDENFEPVALARQLLAANRGVDPEEVSEKDAEAAASVLEAYAHSVRFNAHGADQQSLDHDRLDALARQGYPITSDDVSPEEELAQRAAEWDAEQDEPIDVMAGRHWRLLVARQEGLPGPTVSDVDADLDRNIRQLRAVDLGVDPDDLLAGAALHGTHLAPRIPTEESPQQFPVLESEAQTRAHAGHAYHHLEGHLKERRANEDDQAYALRMHLYADAAGGVDRKTGRSIDVLKANGFDERAIADAMRGKRNEVTDFRVNVPEEQRVAIDSYVARESLTRGAPMPGPQRPTSGPRAWAHSVGEFFGRGR